MEKQNDDIFFFHLTNEPKETNKDLLGREVEFHTSVEYSKSIYLPELLSHKWHEGV